MVMLNASYKSSINTSDNTQKGPKREIFCNIVKYVKIIILKTICLVNAAFPISLLRHKV